MGEEDEADDRSPPRPTAPAPGAYYGTSAPLLDFAQEAFDCLRINAEIATKYAEIGDVAGLDYSARKIAAYLRAVAPIVKALRSGQTLGEPTP